MAPQYLLLLKICFYLLLIEPVFASPTPPSTPTEEDQPIPHRTVPRWLPGIGMDPIRPIFSGNPKYLIGYLDSAGDLESEHGRKETTKQVLGTYAKGTCSFRLKETHACSLGDRVFGHVTLRDAKERKIGRDSRQFGAIGALIDEKAGPHKLTSKLPHDIFILAHGKNDPIEFKYGEHAWTSHTKKGKARCEMGRWESKSRSQTPCDTPRIRQMDCFFPC